MTNLNNFYTYIHLRATDDIVFYVGHGNARRAYVLNDRNEFWHRTVYKHGYYVKLIHTNLTKEEASNKEITLIAYYREISGAKLTNMTFGGDGGMSGFSHSEESKKKISEAAKGNDHWKLSAGFKGKKHSEETKQKIKEKRALQVATWAGKPLTEETKEKLRQANLGKKQTPETIAKKVLAQTGSIRSPEAIAKTSEKCKGQKRTPEQREKMKLAQQVNKPWEGKKHSYETKEKMRLSWLKRKNILPSTD